MSVRPQTLEIAATKVGTRSLSFIRLQTFSR